MKIIFWMLFTLTFSVNSSELDKPLFTKKELEEVAFLKSHQYTFMQQQKLLTLRSEEFFKNLLLFKQKEMRAQDKWAWLEKEERKEFYQKLLLKLEEF